MIRLDSVNKSFVTDTVRHQILNDLDLNVNAGEIIAMAGPSGSGKTTVLALLAGWTNPDSGHVIVIDETMNLSDRSWSDVAVVPQSLGLLPELTIAENIALPLTTNGTDSSTPIDELTDELGITHLAKRFPDEVSLGEQQRTAIARAAVANPKVVLADEPIAHQNQQRARNVMDVLQRLARSGTTVLLATHNELAFHYCHRILRMAGGSLTPDSKQSGAGDQTSAT